MKYTKWGTTQTIPTDGELCISIDASNGQWIATYCSGMAASVVCEKRGTGKHFTLTVVRYKKIKFQPLYFSFTSAII